MTDKELIKQEIEKQIDYAEDDTRYTESYREGLIAAYQTIKAFIDSIPEEPCCKIDLTAENENKMFEEIDRYCTLCMDINCFGCEYHDIHFRNIIKDGTIH